MAKGSCLGMVLLIGLVGAIFVVFELTKANVLVGIVPLLLLAMIVGGLKALR